MPSVFTDEVGTFDLTIATPADWTIHAADLPNGENSASLATTLVQNAKWAGEDFCIPNGAGSEVRVFEVWAKVTAGTLDRVIATVRTDSTSIGTTHRHWMVYLDTTEQLVFNWFNTAGGSYLTATTAPLSAGWHHIVVEVQCGASKSVEIQIDGSAASSSSSTSGTPTTAASAAYELYVGAGRTNANLEMTDHMAMLAWYEAELSDARIDAHYLAMTSP